MVLNSTDNPESNQPDAAEIRTNYETAGHQSSDRLPEPGHNGQEPERSRPYNRLKAYVVSDVHLNNHPYNHEAEIENPRRRNFRLFLSQINETLQATDKVLLILNGDILDINGSWFLDVMPWDADRKHVESHLCRLLLQIMENNLSTFDEIRTLLRHPMTEVVYVIGNHDGLLKHYPASHDVVREFLSPKEEDRNRIHFVDAFECEELDLYVTHGHQLDPFNYSESAEPPLGDVINILIVNRFVELALAKLGENGYPDEFIRRMHNRLHDIEYLRPLSLVPVWFQNTAKQFQDHPESAGKRKSITTILYETVSEILNDPQMMRYMTRRLHLPRGVLITVIKAALAIPGVMPLLSFITSKIVRKGHSNKYQYKFAQRLHQQKGYRLVAFGHTHVPGVLPLSQDAYYFNTGSWKPVINLFKYSKDSVELEYLNPDVQFNKVERSGILRIEKTDFDGRGIPSEFALQTIQSGLT